MNPLRQIFKLTFGKRLPHYEGAFQLKGIDKTVKITRDRWAVPHIEAKNEFDAFFALGFCQAQDRAFQIESLTRIARGKLSELLGKKALPIDRIARRIGFSRSAQSQFQILDDHIKQVFSSFKEGYNQGLSRGLSKNPLEFAILRKTPTPFEDDTSLNILAIMSFFLPSNWDSEIARLMILSLDGEEALKKLESGYSSLDPKILLEIEPALVGLSKDLSLVRDHFHLMGASNTWAISGKKTQSSNPILSNDVHLASLVPPVFYLCHLHSPELQVAGGTLAGTPLIISGHNENIAYGITAGLVDNVDLFIEKLDDMGKAKGPSGWEETEEIEEPISVRFAQNHVEKVCVTARGPVVSPALIGQSHALSLRATWLDPKFNAGRVFGIMKAKTFSEFRDALKDWQGLSLRCSYVDRNGNIGQQLISQPPVRKIGQGLIPLPAWLEGVSWNEVVPFEKMPYEENPEEGYVASANSVPKKGASFLGFDWLEPQRTLLIQKRIEEKEDWTPRDCADLQMNQESYSWPLVREKLLSVVEDSKIRETLERWDGNVGPESVAATVYLSWIYQLLEQLIKKVAPHSWKWALGDSSAGELVPVSYYGMRRVSWLVHLILKEPDGYVEDWKKEYQVAFQKAQENLISRFGADHNEWAWGKITPLILEHGFSKIPGMGSVFNLGPVPWGGDTNTISQAMIDPRDLYRSALCIGVMRTVIEVGNWDEARFVLAGGQSGNVFSPHYRDQFELWKRGDSIPLAWSSEAVSRVKKYELKITPELG